MDRRSRHLFAILVLAALPLTACGNDAISERSDRSERAGVASPTPSSGSFTLTPSDEEAPGTRLVTNPYYDIRVPSGFQSRPGQSGAAPSEFLEPPESDESHPVRLYLVVDKEPRSTALEQSYVAEVVSKGQGVEVERSEISWPGAQQAVLLRIERQPEAVSALGASAGPNGPMTSVQIFAQVNDQLIVNVVAYGPSEEMESSGLLAAVRSFRPKAG